MTALLVIYALGVLALSWVLVRIGKDEPPAAPGWPLWAVGMVALWPLVVIAAIGMELWWWFSPWEKR
jgi:hypothetical protein